MRQFAGLIASAKRASGLEAAPCEPAGNARRRAFVASHLLVGVLPFAALPVLLALGADLKGPTLALFAWSTAPILIALHLVRTGDLDRSCAMSAVAFAAFASGVAALDGGVLSPAMPWLVLPLIETALSGSRRAFAVAACAGLAALVVLTVGSVSGLLPPAGASALVSFAGFVAASYGAVLALRAVALISSGESADRAGRALIDLFSGSVNDLLTRHAPNGAATYVSPAAQRLIGCSPRELAGDGLFARVHIADRPLFLQTLSQAGASDERLSAEIRLRRDDGDRSGPGFAWFEMRAHRSAPEGEAPGVVAVFRDVSERRAGHEALVAAREEAERASLAKTRFLAHMSHELRTPLNAIIGFSEALSDEQLIRLSPDRRAEYAVLIHRSGGHLLEVVNSILDMAKIESGAFGILPEPCALAPVVGRCIEMMAMKAEGAGLSLAAHIAPGLPEIHADRRALTQILLNLVANAIKFTPSGGRVTVEVEAGGDGVTLRVRDTGVGIAPEAIDRLGEPFFQADQGYGRSHEGAGLGLSVTRGLVALHHGEMTVESTLGAGCCVSVRLPVDGSAATRRPFAPAARPRFIESQVAREKRRA